MVEGVPSRKLMFHHRLIEAYARLKLCQHDIVRVLLGEGFAIAREHGFLKGFIWAPHMMAELCAEAIDAGIEVSHVHHIVRTHQLVPPAGAGDNWPWPIRIYVLGAFELRLAGQSLMFSGKAQKKPLELLKALVAKGNAGAEQSLLAQELWPESEGDAADSAVRMALHRMRKLLRSEEAVKVQEGKLKLNSGLCWVDAWTFEHLCRELEFSREPSRLRCVIDLYRGEAFATEAPQPWMLAARDRWRARFLRVIRVIGQTQEQRKAWAQASASYEAGIAADPLCEEFHQQLMACMLRQGKIAEAYAAYRRCRDTLFITLGVKPSAKTESLRAQIAAQGAA
jgi:DNA-binding SARP family transcriptional activator